jgi:hypothetical protein
MSVATIPLRVYARPHGLTDIIRVVIDAPWGSVGDALARLGVEFAVEYLDPSVGFALSAEHGDEILAYRFTDMAGLPCTTLVKEAYRNFMR